VAFLPPTLRKVLFQIHLWAGLGVGLYVLVISITGSALVLREEIEIGLYPHLFRHDGLAEPPATTTAVLDGVRSSYPDFTISAIYSPAGKRDTFMVYVNRSGDYRTLYADPGTGDVLGEVPEDTVITLAQDLHFNLVAGSTGRLLNGIGGFALALVGVTGLLIWWPGVKAWTRGLRVDFHKNWRRITWELHGAVGFWSVSLILMWGITGAYFTFPQQFRASVNAVSPTTTFVPPMSSRPGGNASTPPDIDALAAEAVKASPGRDLWLVSFPPTDDGALQIVTAAIGRDRWATRAHREFYFDRFNGDLLAQRDPVHRSAGDIIMAWIVPLHFGTFAGLPVKTLWAVLGLMPALLFGTGAVIWWNRVVRGGRGRAA